MANQETATVRVVVVDDEALMRAGLSMILGSAPDLEVVAVCDGPAALDTVVRHRPDVVLLDIHMPDVSGLAVLPRLRALPDAPVVAMLSAFASDDFVYTALLEGAAGYLLKDSDPAQLIREVRALATGSRPLAPAVAPLVIDGYLARGSASAARKAATLSSREREVLALVARGLTNAEIARALNLAPSTVKDYVHSLIGRLGLRNRVQAAVLADRAGLLREEFPPHGEAAR